VKFTLQPSPIKRDLLLKLLCTCWVITKLLCCKLWLADRFFPLAPVHDVLLYVSSFVHTGLFWLSISCMVLIWIFPGRKIAVILFLSEIASCTLDQNRWQPWEYQFICMVGAYVFIQDEKKRKLSWQLIIVGIYFFSGLNKFNSYFIHNIWNGLFLKEFAGVYGAGTWLLRAGYLMPLIEMTGAIALCFGRTRRIAVWALSAMHLLNLIVFGPLGLNMNSVIWPWNVLMPFLLYGLFYKEGMQFSRSTWKPVYTMLMILAWWILPWLQLVGLWDKYLSGVFDTSSAENLYICTEDRYATLRLSDCFLSGIKDIPCPIALSTYKWSMREMNVAPYPELRIYRAIAENWNLSFPGGRNRFFLMRAGFLISVRPLLVSEK